MYEQKIIENLREFSAKYQYEDQKLSETCFRAADAIEELQSQLPKWIPVTERLPEEKGFYLVFSPLGIIGTAYFGAKWFVEDSRINVKNITHWMPLLEPPKEET